MTAYPGCAGLARSPFVPIEHISSTYIYMYGDTYAIFMPRIRDVGGVSPLPFFVCASRSNVVTNGNGTGTKNV